MRRAHVPCVAHHLSLSIGALFRRCARSTDIGHSITFDAAGIGVSLAGVSEPKLEEQAPLHIVETVDDELTL